MSRLARLPIFAILSLAAAVALPWSAAAQTSGVPLSGRVVDEAGLPVPGATVTVRDSRGSFRKASTGGDGAFSVTDVERGMALVTVSSPGWQSRRMSAEIPVRGDPSGAQDRGACRNRGRDRRGRDRRDDRRGRHDWIGGRHRRRSTRARERRPSYELLKKVPGVYVNDFNQGVVAGGIGIRTFPHVYSGGYRQSDGYRDNSEIDRLAFPASGSSLPRVTGFASARSCGPSTSRRRPGYLTLDEARTRPRSSPLFSATEWGRAPLPACECARRPAHRRPLFGFSKGLLSDVRAEAVRAFHRGLGPAGQVRG